MLIPYIQSYSMQMGCSVSQDVTFNKAFCGLFELCAYNTGLHACVAVTCTSAGHARTYVHAGVSEMFLKYK